MTKEAVAVVEEVAETNHVETRERFDAVLAGFKSATVKSMEYAREAAEMSILHFEEHGDLKYVYDFIEAVNTSGKNYVRLNAYLIWLMAHSPAIWDRASKKVKKDKTKEAIEFNTEAALAKPFWEFKPESGAELFDTMDLINALKALVKRNENENKRKPQNKAASETLLEIKNFQQMLEKKRTKLVAA
jgi:hypothetical protein